MTRLDRLRLLLIVAAVSIAVWIGLERTAGHVVPPTPSPTGFATFSPPPLPSPTPIAGLHDYAAPLRVAPTALPTPAQSARPKVRPEATHTRSWSGSGAIRVRGYATWYATGPSGLFAAAGPTLRRALGPGWRGSRVLVCRVRRCVEVKLVDWCACGKRNGIPTVLDLSDEAFAAIARLGAGVVRVTVEGFR